MLQMVRSYSMGRLAMGRAAMDRVSSVMGSGEALLVGAGGLAAVAGAGLLPVCLHSLAILKAVVFLWKPGRKFLFKANL